MTVISEGNVIKMDNEQKIKFFPSIMTSIIIILFCSLIVIAIAPQPTSHIINRIANWEEVTIINRSTAETEIAGHTLMLIWGVGTGDHSSGALFFGTPWRDVELHDTNFWLPEHELWLYSTTHNDSITLSLRKLPNTWILFHPIDGMGEVVVVVDGNEHIVDLTNSWSFYPFQDSDFTWRYTAIYVSIYVIAVVFLFMLFCVLCQLVNKISMERNEKK